LSRIRSLAKSLSSERISFTKMLDASGVLLDVESLQVFSLNETGLFLAEALRDGVDNRKDLVRRLVAEYEIEESTAAADVEAFVDELSRRLIGSEE
jgi:hypothetical protein